MTLEEARIKFTLRMPRFLMVRLRRIAKRRGVSVNLLIVEFLDRS